MLPPRRSVESVCSTTSPPCATWRRIESSPRPRVTPADEVRRLHARRAERRRGGQTGNENARGRRDAVTGPPAHRAFDTYTAKNAESLRRNGFVVDPARRSAHLGRVSIMTDGGRFTVYNTARPQDGNPSYIDPADAFAHAVTAHGKAGGTFAPRETYWPKGVPPNLFGVGMRIRPVDPA